MKHSLRAPAIAAMVLAGLLTGCSAGFSASSIQPYAPSDGVRADSGDLRILNALVVANSSTTGGVVSATIVNRGTTEDRLTDVTSPDGEVSFTGDGRLAPGTAVRLGADTDPSATLTGLTKLPGETITVKLVFDKADPVTLRTLVVPAEGPYASITPSPTATPTE